MFVVQAQPRSGGGMKPNQLRRAGQVPGCLFGGGLAETVPLQLSQSEVKKLLKSKTEGGRVRLEVSGEQMDVLVKEISTAPVSGQIQHLGFQKLEKGRPVSGVAQVVLLNRDKIPVFVSQLVFEIPHRAVGSALTETVEIDLEGMHPGDSIRVCDLPIASCSETELLIDPETVVVTIVDNKRG